MSKAAAATRAAKSTKSTESAKRGAPTHLGAELAGNEMGKQVSDLASSAVCSVVDGVKTATAFCRGFWSGVTK